MTQFFYSGQFMFLRTGRKSPNAFNQMSASMPAPDGMILSPRRKVEGWTLATWRLVAQERRPSLRDDLIEAIEELQKEEIALAQEYRKS